jgi:hypothetical protein
VSADGSNLPQREGSGGAAALDPIVMTSDRIAITIRPDRGASVSSLVALDREWLVPGRRRRVVGATSSFVDEPPHGWDEMAPTVVECSVDGVHLPDHGDAWRGAWQVDGEWLVHTSRLGYELRRRIRLDGARLLADYAVTSTSTPSLPFLWAAHPLVSAPDGTRVDLGDYGGRVIDVTGGPPGVERDLDERLLAIDDVPEGGYRKYVLPPDAPLANATVVHPDGARLRFAWEPEVVPYTAIYLERRAFSSAPTVAVEPQTSWYDSLAFAVEHGRAVVLQPGESLSWSLSVDVEAPSERSRPRVLEKSPFIRLI